VQRTKIEWVVNPDGSRGFTSNPLVGCTKRCWYCYAARQAKRHTSCPACVAFRPHAHWERCEDWRRKKPATIFALSMCEAWDPAFDVMSVFTGLWHRNGRPSLWRRMETHPQHTFIVLTKQPENFAADPPPDLPNLWCGLSVTQGNVSRDVADIMQVWPERFILCAEPLIGKLGVYVPDFARLAWLIIGGMTGPGAIQPPLRVVEELVLAARHYAIPTFVKDNCPWCDEWGPKPRDLPYLPNPGKTA